MTRLTGQSSAHRGQVLACPAQRLDLDLRALELADIKIVYPFARVLRL